MFRLSERASRWLHVAVLPLAAGFLASFGADQAVAHVRRLNFVETLNAPTQSREARISVDPNLKVLTIDDETLAHFDKDENGRLKRTVYAALLRKLQRAGAKTVLFDLIFNSPTAADADLAQALRDTSLNVTLMTQYLQPDEAHPNVRNKAVNERGFIGTFDTIPLYDKARMPNVRLGSAQNAGPDDDNPEQENHILIGAMPIQYQYQGPPLLHGAFQAALQQYGLADRGPDLDVDRHVFRCGGFEFRLGEEQEAFILPPTTSDAIRIVELTKAMRDLDGPAAKSYKGAVVVVGRPGGEPLVRIPDFGEVSGVMFTAMMLNTALSPPGERLTDASAEARLLVAALFATGAFVLGFGRHPARAAVGFTILGIAAWYTPDAFAARFSLVFPRLTPTLAVATAGLAGLLAGVSPLFRTEHRAVGQTEEATVLFLDVRSSTRLLETLGADRYREFMSDLLTAATKVVMSCGGDVERTLGDGLFATFRARRSRHHARCAADAAGELLAAARGVAARHRVEATVGIGFETGIVTGGYVTEAGHRVWSSVGRTVNLAQRLQSASESLGTPVVAGPVAARLVEDVHPIVPLGAVEAKGFREPIPVFSLVESDRAGL